MIVVTRTWIALTVLALMVSMLAPGVASAQDERPAEEAAPAAGLVESVGREFEPAGRSGIPKIGSSGIGLLQVRAAIFDTEAHARQGITAWLEQSRSDDAWNYDVSGVRPIAIETVADETQAWIGTAPYEPDPSESAEVAFVAVRDGTTLYLFTAWSEYAGVEDEVVQIAERMLGIEPLEFAPVPGVPYITGGLWDDLPRIEHLPEGLTWVGDFAPCIGVLAAPPCLAFATPVATPVGQNVGDGNETALAGKCWSSGPTIEGDQMRWDAAPQQVIDPARTYTATIETTAGTIVADLDPQQAPVTVNNFVCLARAGYYDNTPFHRIIRDFMIQGGDPTGTGTGGPGYQVADELPEGEMPYRRGTLAMANAGPNTNGSQFFIVHQDQPEAFPKNYSIFGQVTQGLEVVDALAAMPVADNGRGEESAPTGEVQIVRVTITEHQLATPEGG